MIAARAGALLTAPLAWRGAALVAAALAVASQLVAPTRLTVAAPASPVPAALHLGNSGSTALPKPAEYAAIAEHPLFYPTRRPWVPPPPAAAPDRPAPPPKGASSLENYQLTGVVIGARGRTAVLKVKSGGKTVILDEGQKLDGWTLRAIGPDGLHFEAAGASIDLKFQSPRWPHS
jgi:general secretion pathway protein N